jgi:hypothetical protein
MKISIQLMSFVLALNCASAHAVHGGRSFTTIKGAEALELLRDVSRNGHFVLGANWATAVAPVKCVLGAYREDVNGYERCMIKNIQEDILPRDGTLCNAGTWIQSGSVVASQGENAGNFAGIVHVSLSNEQFWALFARSRSAVECVRMESD